MANRNREVLEALEALVSILSKYGHTVQANFVECLLRLYEAGSPEFERKLASIDMWGGAGAVWDVSIPHGTADRSRFFEALIALADYMSAHTIGPERIRERAASTAAIFRQWLAQGL